MEYHENIILLEIMEKLINIFNSHYVIVPNCPNNITGFEGKYELLYQKGIILPES